MANIILLYRHYYNNRVNQMPEEYHKDMVGNQMGRMDLDGICPYAGEDENGELKLPEESVLREYFDNRATTVKWGGDLKFFGGRPWEFMQEAIKTIEMVEKMMRFMVESGFKPDGLGFLKPMDRKSGTRQFVQRLLKGTFPDKENYVYFRPASDGVNPGFSNCLELPVLSVIFAFRERSRSDEWSIAARQCGVILPKLVNDKVNYSIAAAEKQVEKGRVNPFNILMPNLGEKNRQEATASTAGDAVSDRARQDVQAGREAGSSSSDNPSSKAPPSGKTQRTKKQKR